MFDYAASELDHSIGVPPIIQGCPAAALARSSKPLAMPQGSNEYTMALIKTSTHPVVTGDLPLQPKDELEEPHSGPDSDSDGDTLGGGPGSTRRTRGAGGRFRGASDPQSRAEATKEKNRRAQQRFRHKQKTRMEALESEVARLRGLLAERGIDPGDGIEGKIILY